MAEQLVELNKSSSGNKVLTAQGLIAKNMNSQGQSTSWAGYGFATVVLHDDHTCEVHYVYTVVVNSDTAAGYQFGPSVSAMRASNPDIPNITPQKGGYLIIVAPDGTIQPEASTATGNTPNGFGGMHAVNLSLYPNLWLTGRVYKTDGSAGTWSTVSIVKQARIFGVALGTW